MARTGRGKNMRTSNMPAMTSELPEPLIFDYLTLTERHPRATTTRTPVHGRAAKPVVSPFGLVLSGTELCATWPCPGCGKQLISAVHPVHQPPRRMRCWDCMHG